jgi:hypothetical protein
VRRLQGWPEGIGDDEEEEVLKSRLALDPERSALR